jgi:hypothetical protein
MEAISLQLPKSLRKRVEDLASREGIPVEQFITLAVAEKAALLESGVSQILYLAARARRVGENPRDTLLDLIERVPEVEPDPDDRLP